jgi:hypothetical protein
MKIPPQIVIAHRVLPHENFETTVQVLLRLLNRAQRQFPNVDRVLYLDVDGHKQPAGIYDNDMFELQSKFMAEFLMRFLTRAETPMGVIRNPKPQNNELPEALNLIRLDSSSLNGSLSAGAK